MTATVHAHNEKPNGEAAIGTIVITVNTADQVIRDPAGNIAFQGPAAVQLVAGEATFTLPASDDETLEPSGFTFTATEQLKHVAKSSYRTVDFQTVDGATHHLADFASLDEVAQDPSYGASLNGALGAIENLRDLSDADFLDALSEYLTEHGAGGVSTAAESGTGWSIKAGSLDRYRSSKANPALLTEVVFYGDSTTQGSGDTQGGYVPEIRRQAIADGYGDGGQGIARYSMTALESGDNLAPVFATTVSPGNGNNFDIYSANTPRWNTLNGSVTFQGRGTSCRIYYEAQNGSGRFSYTVDGGSAVTVDSQDALVPGFDGTIGCIEIDGLTEGVHKIVVTNLGRPQSSRPIWYPGGTSLSSPGQTNGFSSGTYYYVVTGVTGSGETLPSAEIINSGVIPNGPRHVSMNIARTIDPSIVTKFRVYRSTTGAPGSFQRVAEVNSSFGSYVGFEDDNTATPGAAAPTTDTSGLPSAVSAYIGVDTEWTRDAGIVWHNSGVSGIDFGSFFGTTASGSPSNAATQAAFGRIQAGTGATETLQKAASSPPWRRPVLALCALGINNQTGSSGDTAVIRAGAERFAKFCRDGEVDGILIVPHFNYSIADPYAVQNRAAIISVADQYGLSWVDFNVALSQGSYAGPNQHLDHSGYVLEGQFLWDHVLSK